MPEPVRIVGNYLSPYVRKVLVVLELKGVEYRIDPIVPFYGDARFAAASPLRRVPVYVDADVTLCDSSVICQYLDDIRPEPSILPVGAKASAKARWLEEFADTRMGDVFIWRLFNQIAIGPAVWGRATDKQIVRQALEEDIPGVLDYLESICPDSPFFCGEQLSIADIAVAAFFRNAAMCRFTIDGARWPRTAAVVDRALSSQPFAGLAVFEDLCIRTPIAAQREALAAMNAPLTEDSWGTDTPQPGIMPLG